jgi:hypothetical protein
VRVSEQRLFCAYTLPLHLDTISYRRPAIVATYSGPPHCTTSPPSLSKTPLPLDLAPMRNTTLPYGPPWAHYLGGYQDRLLGGPLGLPGLCRTTHDGVRRKDYGREVLG